VSCAGGAGRRPVGGRSEAGRRPVGQREALDSLVLTTAPVRPTLSQ
jgi:hypothetical protein